MEKYVLRKSPKESWSTLLITGTIDLTELYSTYYWKNSSSQNQWEQDKDIGNTREQGSSEGNQEAGNTATYLCRNSLASMLPQLPLLSSPLLLLLWRFWPSKFLNSLLDSLPVQRPRSMHLADWACVSCFPWLWERPVGRSGFQGEDRH